MPRREDKDSLESALADIEKQYGVGSVWRMTEAPNKSVDCISSGSLALNDALGIGGFPKGRIVEIYGPESSGKTTLALGCRSPKAWGHMRLHRC